MAKKSCSSKIRRLAEGIKNLTPKEVSSVDAEGLILISIDRKGNSVLMRANLSFAQTLSVIDSCIEIQRKMMDSLIDEINKSRKTEPDMAMKVIKKLVKKDLLDDT